MTAIQRLFIELIPCLLTGFIIGRLNPSISKVLAKPLINYGVPISLVGLLMKSGISIELLKASLISVISIGLMIISLRTIPGLKYIFSTGTFQLGGTLGNSGYFGIPVALALLPSEVLIFSIGYDIGAKLFCWTLGPLLISNKSKIFLQGNLLKSIINSPAIKGLLGAIIFQLTPWHEEITSFIWLPSRVLIFLALAIVGMRIGILSKTFRKDSLFKVAKTISPILILKLFALPLFVWIISQIIGIDKFATNALILQAAAPTAISVLLLSESSDNDQETATYSVVMSTLISLFSIPAWAFVLGVLY